MKFLSLLCVFCLLSCASRPRPVFSVQPDNTVYVPSGAIEMDGKTTTINAFWMHDTEVTNAMYRAFLNSLSSRVREDYLPSQDSIASQLWINEYVDYATDELCDKYPVVGLTKKQMTVYAEWLTLETNKSFEHSDIPVQFRLPTREEWYFAAKAGRNTKYIWMSNQESNAKGCFFANYFDPKKRSALREDFVEAPYYENRMLEGWVKSHDALFVTDNRKWSKTCKKKGACNQAPIGMPYQSASYFPNDYGLYSMGGNVAEMTSNGGAVGGSFRLNADYSNLKNIIPYPFDDDSPQADIGFRLVTTYRSLQESTSN